MDREDLHAPGREPRAGATHWGVRRAARVAGLGLPLALLPACAGAPADDGSAVPARLRAALAASGLAPPDAGPAAPRRAAGASPAGAAAQARVAASLARTGELAGAEEVLAAALAADPDHPALLNQLGRLRLRAGAPQVALALFDRAAPLDRGHESLEGRGIALDLLGRHEEAQAAYRAGLAVAPQQPSVQNNLAMSLMLSGRAAEAVALLEPLAARRDAAPRVVNNLAVARGMTGEAAQGTDAPRLAEAAADLRGLVGATRPGPAEALRAAATAEAPRPLAAALPPAALPPAGAPPPSPPPEPIRTESLTELPLPVPAEPPGPAVEPAAPGPARFAVQVAALPTEDAARAYWTRLRAESPGRFAGREPDIARIEVNQAVVWRLRATGFATPAEARTFCEALRSARRACWVAPA